MALLLLLSSGCARGGSPGTHVSAPESAPPTRAVKVVYEDNEKTSDGPYHLHAELIADGPSHVRLAIRASGFAPMLYVFDGRRLLVHDPEEYRAWQLYDAPQEHPDQYSAVTQWTATPGSAAFAKGCHAATMVGRQRILDRPAVGYHCAAQHFRDGSSVSASLMWLDRATSVLLKQGNVHATVFEQSPRLTAATFATEPPAGAKVEHYAAQGGGALGTPAPGFHLRNVRDTGPRSVGLADYSHRPVVLAFFASDLAFADENDSPHELGSMRALERLTSGGTHPAVLGIQGGDRGKPGYPLIPKGMSFTVVNDPGFDVQQAYGLSNLVGYAFIGSDGDVHQVFNNPPTDNQLKAAVDALK